MQRLLARGDGASEADLWELSPIRLAWTPGRLDAVATLRQLWAPEEQLFIGERHGTEVSTVDTWITRIMADGAAWPHIIPNPLDGEVHQTKTGTPSRRCDAAVCSFRFAVVEFDALTREHQLAFWQAVITGHLLNVAALVDSGGKSLHGWVRVDRCDRDAWERDVEQDLFARWLVPLGVDASCRNEARLSRLPGHTRVDSGRVQRLLYLDGARA